MLPTLAFLYSLHFDDLYEMPPAERDAYVSEAEFFLKLTRGG